MNSRYKVGPDGRKSRDGFKTSSASDVWLPGCVAVKIEDGFAQVRDTKDPDDLTLTFTKAEWSAFVAGVKGGEFDI